MDKKPVVMLIPPTELPIPAVGGGAIETLITNLLDENERENRVRFIVISKDDPIARQISYKKSKIYYLDPSIYSHNTFFLLKIISRLNYSRFNIFRNRFTDKFLQYLDARLDYFSWCCYHIARQERVDYIVNEGRWDEWRWAKFKKLVGGDHLHNHIHCTRAEDIDARKVINNSISISAYVKDHWAIDPTIPGQNAVLYNGISLERFFESIDSKQRHEIRQSLGVTDEECLVVFCGRLIPEKGVKELLDTFELLLNEPIKLLLIGSPAFSKQQMTTFSEQIEQRAENAKNVIPLGYIPNEKMPLYYKISDIQVIPSIWQEGAGLVGIEGMASGLPLVITRSGGMVEYVSEEASIQLPIDERLAQNMADAIKSIANDPEKSLAMANAGKERAKQFSKEAYYHNYLKVLGCFESTN